MIIVIKHSITEGPGLIEEFLKIKGLKFNVIELEKGEHLPKSLMGIDMVVSMGGDMSVYEEKKYPFLKQEDTFLKKTIEKQIPFLGICLGAQLLAKASGAKIKKAPFKEFG